MEEKKVNRLYDRLTDHLMSPLNTSDVFHVVLTEEELLYLRCLIMTDMHHSDTHKIGELSES
jgi:hypothetical protein